jgi:hypothetical protein
MARLAVIVQCHRRRAPGLRNSELARIVGEVTPTAPIAHSKPPSNFSRWTRRRGYLQPRSTRDRARISEWDSCCDPRIAASAVAPMSSVSPCVGTNTPSLATTSSRVSCSSSPPLRAVHSRARVNSHCWSKAPVGDWVSPGNEKSEAQRIASHCCHIQLFSTERASTASYRAAGLYMTSYSREICTDCRHHDANNRLPLSGEIRSFYA